MTRAHNAVLVSYEGETLPITVLARKLHIDKATVSGWHKSGRLLESIAERLAKKQARAAAGALIALAMRNGISSRAFHHRRRRGMRADLAAKAPTGRAKRPS